jgi:hypothetical protein
MYRPARYDSTWSGRLGWFLGSATGDGQLVELVVRGGRSEGECVEEARVERDSLNMIWLHREDERDVGRPPIGSLLQGYGKRVETLWDE